MYDTLILNSSIILDGFEESIQFSNILGKAPGGSSTELASSIDNTLKLPSTMIGEPSFNLKVFSSTFDSILDAVKSLIRDPYGCFEQTSSTTYPMVMALQLL